MARYRATQDPGERRTVGLTVHLTPTERQRLGDEARQAGASIGDYIRQLCQSRGGQPQTVAGVRRNPEAAGIMQALHKATADHPNIGNNLNQIARHLNTTGQLRDLPELREALALYEKLNEQIMEATRRILDSAGI